MSLISGEGNFQELLGQNATQITADIDDLDVLNSMKLEYATPNTNLVVDANKNVVSEDKDSFVNTTNQITWSQVGRQFTATLPQQIATTSDVEFNTIDLSEGSSVAEPALLIGDNSDGWGFYKSGDSLFFGNSRIASRYFFTETAFNPIGGSRTLGSNSNKWNTIYVNNFGNNVNLGNNKLYFTTTDNTISGNGSSNEIYIGTDGDDNRFVFNATSFYSNDNTTDIGKTTNYFNNGYINTLNSSIINATNTINTQKLQFREDKTYIISNADTQINFYTGNQLRLTMGSSFIYPSSNNSYDLGASSQNFRTLYIGTQIQLPFDSSAVVPTINFGDTDNIGFIALNDRNLRVMVNGALRYVFHDNHFRPLANNSYELGVDSTRWQNIYSEGFLMGGEFRSNEYIDGATAGSDEALILMNGRKQFIRMRTGGSPALMSGLIFSYFDTSNFYMYNSTATGNLRIGHNDLISGVGSGYENATDCVDITRNGQLTANLLSSQTINTPQYEIYVDESNLQYIQTITTANTWQNFTNIPTVASTSLIYFTLNGDLLTYTGTEKRRFVLEYKVSARKRGAGAPLIKMAILHNSTIISRTIQEQRKASNDTSTFTGKCFIDLEENDTIRLQVRQTITNDMFIHSWYFSGMDLLQKPI